MNINIDRITGRVAPSLSPLTYSVIVDDDFTLSKLIEVEEGIKQKVNEQNKLLYLDGEENETTESTTVTKTELKEVTNRWTDEEGIEQSNTITVNEPIEWVDNKPVMIPNIINKHITFAENPTEFTVDEILKAKYQSMLDNSNKDYILADSFLNEDDIDLTDINHSANTGIALMQLQANGQAKTKPITLEVAATSFELLEFESDDVEVYLNDEKFTDNKLVLPIATSECTIKFINTTNKAIDIKSYAIAY